MSDLYAFSRRLASAPSAAEINLAIEEYVANLVQRNVELYEAGNGDTGPEDGATPQEMRAAIAEIQRGSIPAKTVEDREGNTWFLRRISQRTPDFGVIAIDLGRTSKDIPLETYQRLDEALSDAAATLERLDVARSLTEARMRSETELLREALIGSVSHELRTPLASILGAATVLTQSPIIGKDERLKSLAGVVHDEAERLNSDIQNLLDATRISRGQVKPRLEWIEPQDIVNSALERRRRRLAGHSIALAMDSNLPLIYVDPVLVEQAFVQVVDNAAKYSPAGSTISVAATRNGRDVIFSVEDTGAGLTPGELSQVGERFFRGSRHSSIAPGSGLGLWIAKAFVAANGGRIRTTSPGADQGTTVSILFPLAHDAPQPEAIPNE
jgi:two-component system sensor histidine kinase KdpD